MYVGRSISPRVHYIYIKNFAWEDQMKTVLYFSYSITVKTVIERET